METLFVGRNIIFLPEVDSTNSYAINLLKNVKVNIAEGTVVHTAHQTNGRGQRGHVWISEYASNLTASVIMKPAFVELKNQFLLYQIAALCCYDVMAEMLNSGQFDIKIKWPNDILVNGKKIAGILIENSVTNNSLNWSVIGIGVNVNQTLFEEGINAVSVKLLLPEKDHNVELILESLCNSMEKYYLLLKNKKDDLVKDLYLKHFFNKDKWQDFEIENTVRSLLVKGIGPKGLLLLEDKNGNQTEFDVKEVKWIL